MTGKIIDITVDALGARGDGIADTPAGRLYIPFAAPGDRLRVRLGASRGVPWALRVRELPDGRPRDHPSGALQRCCAALRRSAPAPARA